MNLTDYIRSKGRGREARDYELVAMNDPLLGDALDGLLEVEGDHQAAIERLQKRIDGASLSRYSPSWRILCGTAAVLLFGAVGLLLLLRPAPPLSGKLPPHAATSACTQPEQTKPNALPSTPLAVTVQTPVTGPVKPVSSIRSDRSQRTQPAATAIDPSPIKGYNTLQKAAFTGSISGQKPLGKNLREQVWVEPSPLPPGKSLPEKLRPTSRLLLPDQPADPVVSRMPPDDRVEFGDRLDIGPSFPNPQPDDLLDGLCEGGG